ncbi:MAG: hemerythrin domain-containing protein [Polyangia bacterium]
MDTAQDPETAPPRAAQLSADHEQLERWFTELSMRAGTGEPRECDALWSEFTRQLEAHLAFEEQEVFPAYERKGPAEAARVQALRGEHAEIRRQADRLGLDLQLHLARADLIDRFLNSLREHAWNERMSIYPWLADAAAQTARVHDGQARGAAGFPAPPRLKTEVDDAPGRSRGV